LASLVCAFLGPRELIVLPGTAPSTCSFSRNSSWAEVTVVATRQMAQETLKLQHTWARDGACGQPCAERGLPVPAPGLQQVLRTGAQKRSTPGTMH